MCHAQCKKDLHHLRNQRSNHQKQSIYQHQYKSHMGENFSATNIKILNKTVEGGLNNFSISKQACTMLSSYVIVQAVLISYQVINYRLWCFTYSLFFCFIIECCI